MERSFNAELANYTAFLRTAEKAPGTVEKYLRDVQSFLRWLGARPLTKENTVGWKEFLLSSGYSPVTINSMLSSLNSFLKYLNRSDCCVKFLKIQRRLYRSPDRELTKAEYCRLVQAAESKGDERLSLLLEAICATGIRVSELRYITVEAVRSGLTEISLKGKIRTILLPRKLCRKLSRYAQKRKIASGEIFLTEGGNPLNRKQIWAAMKALCSLARVDSSKVFPHNLRHLFARTFYKVCRDVVKLANVLGHSSIETTRIYLVTTGIEDARQLELLGLVS